MWRASVPLIGLPAQSAARSKASGDGDTLPFSGLSLPAPEAADEARAGAIHRCSARPLSKDGAAPIDGTVCATIWPTRSLKSSQRWFDEFFLWTEGFHASTTQRARIQLAALRTALQMLEREDSEQIGITLSFGTVERFLDLLIEALDSHAFVTHRIAVVVRGAVDRLRSRYRIRSFCEYLRSRHAAIGYLLTAPTISAEAKALDLVQPDFAKLPAPGSTRIDSWQDFLLEAHVAGIPDEKMIVGGLHTPEQLGVARQLGVPFGQGNAVRPAFAPPAFWTIGP